MIQKKIECRVCKSVDLLHYLDLGSVPVADHFTQEPNIELKFELGINFCKNCGWSQLTNLLDPAFMYQVDYPYDSRVTSTGRTHWKELASSIQARYQLRAGASCLDVGSNTGALLSEFKELGFSVLGVDPSQVACNEASKFGIETICGFFEEISFDSITSIRQEKFSIITATNSFAHVDNLHAWVKAASKLMKSNGVLVIEVPHILELIKSHEFDTVYHEHLSYCSVSPLISLFETYGLEIIHVEKRKIHGGTIRIHVAKIGVHPVEDSVIGIVREEIEAKLQIASTYLEFGSYILEYRNRFRAFLKQFDALRIGILSAPAKGVTFYHFMKMNDFSILGISDKSHMKIGKYFPGTRHKIISDEQLVKLNLDIVLILAWNFAQEIMKDFSKIVSYEVIYVTAIPEIAILKHA